MLHTKDIGAHKFETMKWHAEPTKTVIADAEFFFKNDRAVICPIDKCTLMKADCTTDASDNAYVKVADKWPFNITST